MTSIKFTKPKTESEILKSIDSEIDKNEKYKALFEIVMPLVIKWNGKKYTKRFQTALKALTDGTFFENVYMEVDKTLLGYVRIGFQWYCESEKRYKSFTFELCRDSADFIINVETFLDVKLNTCDKPAGKAKSVKIRATIQAFIITNCNNKYK